MNIKGSWIRKTVDNYIFFLSPPLFWCKSIFTHTHTHTRPLITVSCQAVIEINCSLVQGLVREGRLEVGGEEEVPGGASVSCARGDQKGLDAAEKEEQWHSWIFIASHICSRLAFYLSSPCAVQHRTSVQTKGGDLAASSGSRFAHGGDLSLCRLFKFYVRISIFYSL